MSTKYSVTVLGAGNMGTAIAQVVASNGHLVKLWNHEGDIEPLEQILKFHENKKYSPGIILSDNIHPEADLKKALSGASVVFFAVPSQFAETIISRASSLLDKNTICVDVSKGVNEKSSGLIPDIFQKYIPKHLRATVATISGPAIANDMARGNFTAMNISCREKKSMRLVANLMENKSLKLLATDDMVGVELAGSFKNAYAIGMGICDGLGMSINTKAALLVAALKEISRLVKKMGGKSETVYDLAGLGDLVATGMCATGRNRNFGEALARGLSVDDAEKSVKQTVEGINACKPLHFLAKKYAVKLPFAEMIYRIVWKHANVKDELENFLERY